VGFFNQFLECLPNQQCVNSDNITKILRYLRILIFLNHLVKVGVRWTTILLEWAHHVNN